MEVVLRVGSLDITNMRTYESIESLIQYATINNIDIARIQETRRMGNFGHIWRWRRILRAVYNRKDYK